MTTVSSEIKSLVSNGILTLEEIASIGETTEEVARLWLSGDALPNDRIAKRINETKAIFARLYEYYSKTEVRVWLFHPHPQLEGKRAFDLLKGGDSWSIKKTIDRLDADGYL